MQILGVPTFPTIAGDPASPANGQVWYNSSLGALRFRSGGTTYSVPTTSTATVLPSLCNGRLTLESGVPISTSDQVSKTTVYFTPFNGSTVALYNGTVWAYHALTERSLALGTLTSGKNYDVFIYDNAGTLTLELSSAWTNATTRADAVTLQDGVWVKSGATTRRLLGTFYTTSTTTTEDSLAKRLVANVDNRAQRPVYVHDSTDNWNYTTDTWRQRRAQTTNQIEVAVPLSGLVAVSLTDVAMSNNASGVRRNGISCDSTSAIHANCLTGYCIVATATQHLATLVDCPAVGYHYYASLEKSQASGTSTWYGDIGVPSDAKFGLSGTVTV